MNKIGCTKNTATTIQTTMALYLNTTSMLTQRVVLQADLGHVDPRVVPDQVPGHVQQVSLTPARQAHQRAEARGAGRQAAQLARGRQAAILSLGQAQAAEKCVLCASFLCLIRWVHPPPPPPILLKMPDLNQGLLP